MFSRFITVIKLNPYPVVSMELFEALKVPDKRMKKFAARLSLVYLAL